jgi:hypothetical protein
MKPRAAAPQASLPAAAHTAPQHSDVGAGNVFDEMPSRYDEAPNSFIQLLNETEVCITQSSLPGYDLGADEVEEEIDYKDGKEDDEELEEVD